MFLVIETLTLSPAVVFVLMGTLVLSVPAVYAVSMSMSVSTSRAQSDSMQENTTLVAFGKEGGRGGECSNKGRKTWERKRGEGNTGITKLKTCNFSCRRKEAMTFAW